VVQYTVRESEKMTTQKLIIPELCKVGFNLREDTYTKKLGYVIMFDGKKWRKEVSWRGWIKTVGDIREYGDYDYETRSRKVKTYYTEEDGLEPIEFKNVSTEGFVLNKKVGDYKSEWNHRMGKCRVYDPRGWEFEISFENLLFILQECISNKGKGLEGTFVYAWDGKDLVLLPTSSQDYQDSVAFTEMQTKKVSSKDLVIGRTYINSQNRRQVYLGRYLSVKWTTYNLSAEALKDKLIEDPYISNLKSYNKGHYTPKNNYIFQPLEESYGYYPEILSSLESIKMCESENIHPQTADYIDKFEKSDYVWKHPKPDKTPIDSATFYDLISRTADAKLDRELGYVVLLDDYKIFSGKQARYKYPTNEIEIYGKGKPYYYSSYRHNLETVVFETLTPETFLKKYTYSK
jgi:hypothetical protein